MFVAWLKTFLVNGFWGVVLIGLAIAGVYYYPRVVGHYVGEGPEDGAKTEQTAEEGGQK
jgi:hypothetical protein